MKSLLTKARASIGCKKSTKTFHGTVGGSLPSMYRSLRSALRLSKAKYDDDSEDNKNEDDDEDNEENNYDHDNDDNEDNDDDGNADSEEDQRGIGCD